METNHVNHHTKSDILQGAIVPWPAPDMADWWWARRFRWWIVMSIWSWSLENSGRDLESQNSPQRGLGGCKNSERLGHRCRKRMGTPWRRFYIYIYYIYIYIKYIYIYYYYYYLSWKEAQTELKTWAKYLWECLDPEGFMKILKNDEVLYSAKQPHW